MVPLISERDRRQAVSLPPSYDKLGFLLRPATLNQRSRFACFDAASISARADSSSHLFRRQSPLYNTHAVQLS